MSGLLNLLRWRTRDLSIITAGARFVRRGDGLPSAILPRKKRSLLSLAPPLPVWLRHLSFTHLLTRTCPLLIDDSIQIPGGKLLAVGNFSPQRGNFPQRGVFLPKPESLPTQDHAFANKTVNSPSALRYPRRGACESADRSEAGGAAGGGAVFRSPYSQRAGP